jgi:hypothetical protein
MLISGPPADRRSEVASAAGERQDDMHGPRDPGIMCDPGR